MNTDPLPAPCPLCAPNDGAWMDTPGGLIRCTCARGKALKTGENARHQQALAKGRKQAEKAAAGRKVKLARQQEDRLARRKLAEKYRPLPLVDGGSEE